MVDIIERQARRPVRGRPPFCVGHHREEAPGSRLGGSGGQAGGTRVSSATKTGIGLRRGLQRAATAPFSTDAGIGEAIEVREGDEIDVGTTRMLVTSVRPGMTLSDPR